MLSPNKDLLIRAKQICVFFALICSLLFISNAQATYYGYKANNYSYNYNNHYGYKNYGYNYNKYSHKKYSYNNKYIYNNQHNCNSYNNYSYNKYDYKSHWWKKKNYAKGSVGDRVWLDNNANGIQDSGENGAANVYVKLYKCGYNKVLKYTKTDASGKYKFSDLTAGKYKIAVKPEYQNPNLQGVTFSAYGQGDSTSLDSNVQSSQNTQWGIIGYTGCFNVESGKFNSSIDAGLILPESNLLPEANNDEYTGSVDIEFSQNVFTDNDTEGDGGITVSYVSGDIPNGLELDEDGVLSGTPTDYGTYTFTYEITDQDGDSDTAEVTITILGDVAYCPVSAEDGEFTKYSGGHSIWIPGISKDLDFKQPSDAIQTLPNGNLQVSGIVEDGDIRFEVNLVYSDFIESSSDPKLELNNSAYVNNGGPVDPDNWNFYSNISGTLTGVGGDWNGYQLSVTRRGPMAQIGEGANGKNINFGLSNWFDFEVTTIPDETETPVAQLGETFYGDINVDLKDECEPVVGECAECDGKVDMMDMLYLGDDIASVIVLTRKGVELFSGTVDPSNPRFTLNGADNYLDNKKTLGPAIYFYVDGVEVGMLHTSCSVPIGPGTTVGDFMVEFATSRNNGALCPVNLIPDAIDDSYTGEVGTPFSQNIMNENDVQGDGIGTVAYVSGDPLPDGLTLDTDGSLSGTPTEAGVFVFTYSLTDEDGDSDEAQVTITIEEPNLTPDAIDDNYTGEVGVPFTQNIMDENDIQGNGIGTIAYVSGDPLPNGLTLLSDGSLSGTPTESGTFVFTYSLTDEDGDSDEAQVTIVIDEANLVPIAEDNSYTLQLQESLLTNIVLNDTQGDGIGTVSVVSGTVPLGFNLTPSGILNGASFFQTGVFTFTYRLTDEDGDFDDAQVTITIEEPQPSALDAVDDCFAFDIATGNSFTANVMLNDSLGTEPSTASLTGPAPLGITLLPNGQLTVNSFGQLTSFTFDYRLTDSVLSSDTATITVHLQFGTSDACDGSD